MCKILKIMKESLKISRKNFSNFSILILNQKLTKNNFYKNILTVFR